jgi:microcystin-dependent protein
LGFIRLQLKDKNSGFLLRHFVQFKFRRNFMGSPYLSEIRIFTREFAPKGWALCNGQFLPINQNQPLFSLLGTTYGGNGQTTFALPDLRGRVPIHAGNGHGLGTNGGQQAHTLIIAELPQHSHFVSASNSDGALATPVGNHWGSHSERPYSADATNLVAMQPTGTTNTGGGQAHLNMQPYLTLSFIICLQGFFPSPN